MQVGFGEGPTNKWGKERKKRNRENTQGEEGWKRGQEGLITLIRRETA